MNIKIIFRILVALPIVLMLIYYFLPSVEYLWLSCDELSLLEADGFNSIIPQSYILFIIYMVVWLLVSIGLFLFISWFRIIYINFIIVSLALILFLGNRVSSPGETLIGLIMTLLIGAILGLMYSASLAPCFNKEAVSEDKDKDDEEDEDDELP